MAEIALLRNCYPLQLDTQGRWIKMPVYIWMTTLVCLRAEEGHVSQFNLIDEKWIPVRFTDGSRGELGIRDTLLRSKEIAIIEDNSPLVVAALHRFLLAVLYRSLEGPTDINQGKAMFMSGFPAGKIEAYLTKWRDRFWIFDEIYPFGQVPTFMPKEWHSWTVLSTEFNDAFSKVLFDHVDVRVPGSISVSAAARWLFATLTFSIGKGNSELAYTSSAPSATGVMVIPLGRNLEDTLMFSLVPQSRLISAGIILFGKEKRKTSDT